MLRDLPFDPRYNKGKASLRCPAGKRRTYHLSSSIENHDRRIHAGQRKKAALMKERVCLHAACDCNATRHNSRGGPAGSKNAPPQEVRFNKKKISKKSRNEKK
jgi:hypothetical protein